MGPKLRTIKFEYAGGWWKRAKSILMEQHVQLIRTQKPPMNPILPKNRLLLFSVGSQLRPLCSSRISVKASDAELKHNWLASLSCPFPHITDAEKDSNPSLVFGIDPDVSGALALLKGDHSAQVLDVWFSLFN